MTRRSLRTRATAALAAAVACGALAAAGCGGSNGSSQSPPPASTAAHASTAPATTIPPATTAPTTPAPPLRPGDVAAGKAVFAQNCDTCHAGLGTRTYIGPRLAGLGLTPVFIRTRVEQGKSPMPAGLVGGQDLADVVAYVHSLQ